MPCPNTCPKCDDCQAEKLDELWMLWSDVLGWVEAEDSVGDPRLAFLSEEEAHESAAWHQKELSIFCTPVNVLART
jgi:hypothetical protein